MKDDLRIQVWCLWCGAVFAVLFGVGIVLAGFVPPPSPADTAAQTQEFYRSNANAIRVGMVVMTETMVFPGLTALPTCLGTVLLIHTGSHGTTSANRLLANPLEQAAVIFGVVVQLDVIER